MAEHGRRHEAEGGTLAVAEDLSQVVVIFLKIAESVVLRAEPAVLGEGTLVFRLELVECHQVLAEASDAALDGTAGTGDRREDSEEPGLHV